MKTFEELARAGEAMNVEVDCDGDAMLTVHKITLDILGKPQQHRVHRGAKVLTSQLQGGNIVVWLSVNTEMPMCYRLFRLVPTGGRIAFEPDDPADRSPITYVATVQTGDGLVWHVFDWGEG